MIAATHSGRQVKIKFFTQIIKKNLELLSFPPLVVDADYAIGQDIELPKQPRWIEINLSKLIMD